MAANANDKFIKTGEGTATTLASPGYTIGNSSITVVSTTNWPTDTAVIFAIDVAEIVDNAQVQVDGSYTEYVGIVSGATSITSASLVKGTPQDYSAGALTRVYIPLSSETQERLVDGLLEEHNQDGTHSDVTATTVTTTGDINAGANVKVTNGSSINDENSNELIKFAQTTSAVNELSVTNAATGNAPSLSATGGDSNINVELTPKGTGKVTRGGYPIDWWQEIGRTTLGSAGDTITVSSLPARKFLKVLVSVVATGGTVNFTVQFNGDTGANYAQRYSVNGAADSTATSATNLVAHGGTTSVGSQSEIQITNIATTEKVISFFATSANASGAGSSPLRIEGTGKWSNTSVQISSITITNGGTGDYAIGSEVVVLGHD